MAQNYNYYPQQNPHQQTPQAPVPTPGYLRPQYPQTVLKGRPVSSLEEARVAPIDFDGSVFYFPDVANRKIYTKQINMDGTASLNVYDLQEVPNMASVAELQGKASALNEEFITRKEFERVIAELKTCSVPAYDKPKEELKSF